MAGIVGHCVADAQGAGDGGRDGTGGPGSSASALSLTYSAPGAGAGDDWPAFVAGSVSGPVTWSPATVRPAAVRREAGRAGLRGVPGALVVEVRAGAAGRSPERCAWVCHEGAGLRRARRMRAVR